MEQRDESAATQGGAAGKGGQAGRMLLWIQGPAPWSAAAAVAADRLGPEPPATPAAATSSKGSRV